MVNSYGLGLKEVDFFQQKNFESFEEMCFSGPNLINFAMLKKMWKIWQLQLKVAMWIGNECSPNNN